MFAMSSRSPLVPALLSVLVAGSLAGQVPPIPLEEIVVTAHRTPRAVRAIPAHVTVLDGEELERAGHVVLLDALRSVAGLHVVQGGSFGAVTSVFVRGGESDYVQVLVDGVPVNAPGGQYDFAHLSVEQIDRVEIVRGPASSLYGSDAVSAVIQVITRTGTGAPRARLSVRGGTYDSWHVTGGVEGGTGSVQYGFAGSLFRSDGLLELNNDYDNGSFSSRVEARPDSATRASIAVHFLDQAFHFPTDGGGAIVDENAFTFGDEWTIGLDLARRLASAVELRAQLGSHDTNGGTDDRTDGPADTLGFFAFQSLEDTRRLFADLAADFETSGAGSATLGFAVEQQDLRSFNESSSEFGPSTGSSDEERTNRAFYGQWLGEWAPVATNASARVEDNEAFGSFVTFSAGAAVYLPGPGTKLRATVGRGIKEPTLLENFATGFAVGNPDLDPERSLSWELGADQELLDGRVRLSGTYFDQSFRDLIQFTFTPPSEGAPNFFNVAEADARGLELESSAALGPLEAGATYTFLDSEVVDAGFEEGPDATFVEGERLLRRPTHQFGVQVGAILSDGRAIRTRLRWVGSRDDRDFGDFPAVRVELPAYVVLDLDGELRLWEPASSRPGLSLIGRVENLLDEEYEEVVGFPARGRTILVGGRIELGR